MGPTRFELDPYFSTIIGGDGSTFIERCDYSIARNDGSGAGGTDLNIRKVKRTTINTVAVSHHRGPMIVSGWGFDSGDRPVPNVGASPFQSDPELVENRQLWKSGPVALQWDLERAVWSMGHHMLSGILIGAITAPTDPCDPTTFKIKVFRDTSFNGAGDCKWALGETLVVRNRDISLQQPDIEDFVFVIVARINYEWLPVWVGCPPNCPGNDNQDPNYVCEKPACAQEQSG